jgi:hypothetical protein
MCPEGAARALRACSAAQIDLVEFPRKRADRDWKGEVPMTAIIQALFRSYSAREIETLKQIAMLCGAGLLVSLLALTYGIDLSPGFF